MIETVWYKKLWDWLMSGITLVTRVMKLEERLSALEKKIETLQAPTKDIKEGLEYNQIWDFYENKATKECFCSACLGNGKKITVTVQQIPWAPHLRRWICSNCKKEKSE